ncbi:extracellular solute-binding protein [Paenibacillus harenae]|uniref:Aldouronate transport system substrate-binding protein n=1 Tax=Paenibacillus harenae TaxID=306543 RepID=A0ABT9UAD6_PAEHA|nr:extracellular solute-binding protein [Paenibacillus harenae]MDQ0116612.1 putative aldouronate transport system substrate-binding protein [Paenibacillus harenae]
MKKKWFVPAALLIVMTAMYGLYQMGDWTQSHDSPSPRKEPETLTTVFSLRPSLSFKNGESIEDNVHTRSVQEKLGIDIQYVWTAPDSTFSTKLKLQLLNKREMPDIIPVRTDVIHQLIDSGQFMAVDDLFEQYASPVWKKAMNENSSVWYPYERNGKHYAIPILDYNYNSDPMMWIREDWLEKVGLSPPTTLQELEKVLDAFTRNDPDGNGKNDTYGLAVSLGNTISTWMADISWVFGMYGCLPEQWNFCGNPHQLEFGSIHHSAKQGLIKLREWRAAGYFPDEALWQDEESAARLFSQGKAGIVVGPHWMKFWPLNALSEKNPETKFIAIPLPEGPDGSSYHRASQPRNGAILINKKIKNPQTFFRYMNDLYETQGLGEGEFAFGMARGYDFTTVNGEPSSDRSLIPGGYVDVTAYTLTYDGARIPSHWTKMIDETEKTVLTRLHASRLPNEFQGPPTPTMLEKGDQLLQTEHEAFVQIIYGKKDIDFFDEFVANWRANGGDQITKEVNAWYHSVHEISK